MTEERRDWSPDWHTDTPWFTAAALIVIPLRYERAGIEVGNDFWAAEAFAVDDSPDPIAELGDRLRAVALEREAGLVAVGPIMVRALVSLDEPKRAILQHYCYAAFCAGEVGRRLLAAAPGMTKPDPWRS